MYKNYSIQKRFFIEKVDFQTDTLPIYGKYFQTFVIARKRNANLLVCILIFYDTYKNCIRLCWSADEQRSFFSGQATGKGKKK